MATGVRAMVIRSGDEVMWVNPGGRCRYTQGRVIEIRYEAVVCRPFGEQSPDFDQEVELVHLRVRRPKLLAGDIVSLSSPTGRTLQEARQGVVRPYRLADGFGWRTVEWERGGSTRQLPMDLLRIPVSDQHPSLWPLSADLGDSIATLKKLLHRTAD
jgi:hypothetical protein